MAIGLITIIAMVTPSSAHVTFEPNIVDTGYNLVHFKVPHGMQNEVSTKLIIDVPDGVLAVKPERHEWMHTRVIMGPLAKPYTSHGRQVNTGPKRIELEARAEHKGLHNDHLFLLAMQLKIGCDLSSPSTSLPNATTTVVEGWQGKTATLFWPTRQFTTHEDSATHHHNASTLSWTGVPVPPDNTKSTSWGSLKPKPAPYVFIRSWEGCVTSKGLTIGGKTLPLSSSPSSTSTLPSTIKVSNSGGGNEETKTKHKVAVASLIMACLSVVFMFMLGVYIKKMGHDRGVYETWRRANSIPVAVDGEDKDVKADVDETGSESAAVKIGMTAGDKE